jgi:hypothetical protein
VYNLGICSLCFEPMTLLEITEGVRWEIREKSWLYGYYFWEPEEENRVAHRRCWKELPEDRRKQIRHRADKVPKSLGQLV